MELPDGWKVFYQGVCERTQALSKNQIWNNDASSMLAWLANFSREEHQYIASHILDRLTFRTERMTESAYRLFFASKFRYFCQQQFGQLGDNVEDWLLGLKSRECRWAEDILICSVSKAGEHGESGSHMIRILTGDLIHQQHVFPIDAKQLDSEENKIILIVDDFLGSGRQFKKFSKETNLREAAAKNKIIYAPSMAYYKGVDSLAKEDYGIDVAPLEIVTRKEQFFSHEPNAAFCGDDINSEDSVLEVYNDMRQLDDSFNSNAWLGFKKASLCVGFQWGCPNQSLGIMWYEGQSNWHRLLKRRGSL